MNLTLLIPAYNEADRIRSTLDAYGQALNSRDAELIVIVNGSRDRTEHLVRKEFIPRFPFIRLIVIPEKVGKGGALIRGLSEARGNKIAFTDADGSTPPAALLDLVDKLSEPGILIGSRWLSHSVIGTPQPLSRQLASRMANRLVRLLFGLNLSDTQCGAKVMAREVVQNVLPRIGTTQWAFDVELLFQIKRAGYPVHESPTEWNDVSGSKIHLLRASCEMTMALVRLRLIYSPFRCIVQVWDSTLGKRLFARRLDRMRSIYGGSDSL